MSEEYRIALPSAEDVREVHLKVDCCGSISISYSTVDSQGIQSDVLVIPEPDPTICLVVGALMISLLRKKGK